MGPKNIDTLYNVFPDPLLPFGIFDEAWDHFVLSDDKEPLELDANRLNRGFLRFLDKRCGGFKNKKVLELGPFEGFHSYDLDRMGVSELLAIEGNPRNYLKCLIVKNHYQLNSVQFRLGNFVDYLLETDKTYDFILAAGVLYHSAKPMVLLEQIIAKTNSFGVCNTFYDPDNLVFRMTGRTREFAIEGIAPITLHERFNVPHVTRKAKHGMGDSAWMISREDLLRYLEFKNFQVEIRESKKPARMQLFAERR